MENEPLLFSSASSPTSPTTTTSPFSVRKHLLSTPSSPLCPLPEHQEVSIPPGPTTTTTTAAAAAAASSPTVSSFKDRLIFGFGDDSSPPLSPSPFAADATWPAKHHHPLHRSRTAPAMAAIHLAAAAEAADPSPRRPSLVRYAFLLLSLYLALGIVIYSLFTTHFAGRETHPAVDALYFCIVTMCTIGYGDITPATPFAKLFSVTFVLFGFGFIDVLLSSMVSYVLDLQESLLLSSISINAPRNNRNNYLVDYKKGRMRIRMKVALALAVVFLCVGIGTAVLRFVERLGWLDSFYLSVTTVGYGDRAFRTMTGRLFASIWLLVSTLAVARAFLYLAEARIDKRHRKIAKWVLSRDMTVSEFLAADIDNNGFVSKSEFVIYKLKEMGKIAEKDVLQICDQFDRLDTGNCGKIRLSDLTESHLN